MQFYFSIAFSVIAAVTVVLQFWPKIKTAQEQPYAIPLLTMIFINLVALLAPQPVNLLYKGAILLGLLVTMLAVAFYTLPKTPPYIAFSHLLIVYFVYFIAFASAMRLAIPSPIILLIIAYAALIFWYAKEPVKEQWGALVAYITLMAFMVWAASELWVQYRNLWSTLAFVGAILLVISNSALLVQKTRKGMSWAVVVVAAAFFLGHLMIAWSVWGAAIGQ